MNYAIIKNKKVSNIIVAERDFAEQIDAIYLGNLPIEINDDFLNDQFRKKIYSYDKETKEQVLDHYAFFKVQDLAFENIPTREIRESLYGSKRYKDDGTGMILWEDEVLTVDEANKKHQQYLAEGSSKALDLQTLIKLAKVYIRELYPDKKEVAGNEK